MFYVLLEEFRIDEVKAKVNRSQKVVTSLTDDRDRNEDASGFNSRRGPLPRLIGFVPRTQDDIINNRQGRRSNYHQEGSESGSREAFVAGFRKSAL